MIVTNMKYIDLETRETCCRIKDIADEMTEELDLDAVINLSKKLLKEVESLALHAIEIDKRSDYEN